MSRSNTRDMTSLHKRILKNEVTAKAENASVTRRGELMRAVWKDLQLSAKVKITIAGKVGHKIARIEQTGDKKLASATLANMFGEYCNRIADTDVVHHDFDRLLPKLIKTLNKAAPGAGDVFKGCKPSFKDVQRRKAKVVEQYVDEYPLIADEFKFAPLEHEIYVRLKLALRPLTAVKNSLVRKNNVTKQENLIQINPDFALTWAKQTIEQALEDEQTKGLNRVKAIPLTIALAITTGRRAIECRKTMKLTKPDTLPEQHLHFKGQAKLKSRAPSEGEFDIPILIDRELVLEGLHLLRRYDKDTDIIYQKLNGERVKAKLLDKTLIDNVKHNHGVSDKFNSSENRQVNNLFCRGVTMHSLRALYAAIAVRDFKVETMSITLFRQRVLGHMNDDMTTQQNYDRVNLNTDVDTAVIREKNAPPARPVNTELVKQLEVIDTLVTEKRRRSPSLGVIHDWLHAEALKGLDSEVLTRHYIRKFYPGGKGVNAKTCETYMNYLTNGGE